MTAETQAPLTAVELDALEEVARAAMQANWCSGHKDIVPTANTLFIAPEVGEFSVFVFNTTELRPNNRHEQYLLEEADAAHIATFSPPTALRLLAQARRALDAERALARYGKHEPTCRKSMPTYDTYGIERTKYIPCSCGLDAALAAAGTPAG